MSNTKLNCCKCGKEFGFTERIYTSGDLWQCEDCAIKQMQENDDKDKTIADLEAKLAESEKKKEDFKVLYFNKCLDYEHLHKKFDDKCAEFELKEYDYKQTIFEKDQDKISFCIEQLEKVKEEAKHYGYEFSKSMHEYIDNQIEELKKEKNV